MLKVSIKYINYILKYIMILIHKNNKLDRKKMLLSKK
jgi:hypothetical protein